MSLRPAQLVSPSRPPSWTSTQWQLVGAPASSLGQPLHLGWGPLALPPNAPLSPVLPLPGPASLWWGLSLQEPILALPATAKVRAGICPTRPLPMLPRPTPPLRPCSCCPVLDPISSPQPPHRARLPGGPVTVTDANLVLGRLLPASFPCIFGPGEDQPLSPEASRKALEAVATEVNSFLTNGPCPASPLSLEEVAMGFVRVANEAMCRPIRALTQVRLTCPLLCLPCPPALLPTPTPPTQATQQRGGGERSRGGGRGPDRVGNAHCPLFWLPRHEAMIPQPTCWLALGELVGSMLVPSPGPWAWTLCTFTGMCGSGPRVLGWGAGFGRHPHIAEAPVPQAQWAAVGTGAGPGRRGARGAGAMLLALCA